MTTKEYGSGVTPLHLAASNGHLEVCKLIMERLDDKNPGTAFQQTPFHWAARDGQFEVCKHMIENFPDKNPAAEASGWTPLHWAAKYGHLDVCKLIIDYLVDKNPKDKHGTTPLHFAAQKSHLEVCRLFLDNITDTNLHVNPRTGFRDDTPYGWAKGYGNQAVCSLFESYINASKEIISP